MITYNKIDQRKQAFIFELDDVLYPEKDYLLQVYYLFANFIEYTETIPAAEDLTHFFKKTLSDHGVENIFDRVKEAFGIDEKYRESFLKLHETAILPLKILLFNKILRLMQEIVIDRKQLFLITNGEPSIQLNKIRQVEWNGLEKYLTVYFAQDFASKPETDSLDFLLDKHKFKRKEALIIGENQVDEEFAHAAGIDFLNSAELL
ncbi:MAG: HAD hydrolase-like protein [Daejeonella sp.]